MAKKFTDAEAENIAAIAMSFSLSKNYGKVHESEHIVASGGHPELYQIAIAAAVELEKFAKKDRIEWGDDAEWVQTVEGLAISIVDALVDGTYDEDDLPQMVEDSIDYYDDGPDER